MVEKRIVKKWTYKDDEENTIILQKELNLSKELSHLLVNRGYNNVEAAKKFLYSNLTELHNPFLFKEMAIAVARVEKAIERKENIVIYGDSDVDGVTATALMYRYLERRTKNISTYTSSNEGYGLNTNVIKRLSDEKVSLIISVDCGITNFEEAELLSELGIDFIIIDHHESQNNHPKATAIIDAKLPSSNYPFRDLAGVGTALKFITACFIANLPEFPKHLVAIDVETTGLNSSSDEIIEIAAAYFHYGQPGETFSTLVSANKPLPAEITKLTGISSKDLENAMNLSDAMKQWHNFIGDSPLLGHNISFDLSFLKRALKKTLKINLKNKSYDTLPLSRTIFPQLTNHKLGTIKEFLQLADYGQHRALADAQYAGQIFFIATEKSLNSKIKKFINYFLDLVTLGTIADVVPLVGENRILAKYGLKKIRSSPSNGLRMLVQRQVQNSQELTSRDISWGIAPIINAAGRAGKGNIALELFTSKNKSDIRKLLDKLKEFYGIQKGKVVEMYEAFLQELPPKHELFQERIICIYKPGFDPGITGVVANRFLGNFNKPAFIITSSEGKATGSARSSKDINVKEILELCEDYFIQFGGHKHAAGFSLQEDKIEPFINYLKIVVNTHIEKVTLLPQLTIDCKLSPSNLNFSLLDDISLLEPFGEANPAPIFSINNIIPLDISSFGVEGKHLKLIIDSNDEPLTAIGWNLGNLADELWESGKKLNIAFLLEKNTWRHRTSLRLIIQDILPSST